MKATDARRHSKEQLEALRERAFAMRKAGSKITDISSALGVVEGTVYKWLRNARKTSQEQATKGGQRGRPKGIGAKLTVEQKSLLRKLIIEKNPKQLKFDFALWTRRAVRALINRKFGIDLSLSRVGVYLRSWGMTVQRPALRAIEQGSERVKKWKEHDYPEIATRAALENAVIYWSDETAVKHDSNWVTGYSTKGQTPILERHDGRWRTATMISAISNQGLLRFKIQDHAMNRESFIDFLEDLIEDELRKIFLIVDYPRGHTSKQVPAWTEAHKDRIELFFLPPYSPELNPDEYVNRAVKTDI